MERERIEEIAANRLQIITPLLDPSLDKAKHQTIKESISIQYGVNERTIRRWINLYNEKGFDGLKPQRSSLSGKSKLPEEIIDAAITLRREVPKRSIAEIIRILEWEGLAEPGSSSIRLCRISLLQEVIPVVRCLLMPRMLLRPDAFRNLGVTIFGSQILNTVYT